MKYLVLDLETSVKNRGEDSIGSHKASPYHPDNKIVAVGSKSDIFGAQVYYEPTPAYFDTKDTVQTDVVLVGHNLAFDLAYLIRDQPSWKEWLKTGTIWDTQLAEYILSGQTIPYPSLDECAAKRGGTLKNDKIKDYWNSGVDTEDIPEEELLEYLKEDVINTEAVFLSQLKEANDRGMLNLMRTQMDARLATIEMEINGMYVDRTELNNGIDWLSTKKEMLEAHIRDTQLPLLITNHHLVDLNSNDHLSVIIFGGEVEVEQRIPLLDVDGNPVVYKSGLKAGEPRFKIEKTVLKGKGIFTPEPAWKLKKEGFYSTADDILENLNSDFVHTLRNLREVNKDLSTYYIGYKKLLWPNNLLHPSLNHCVTKTGRLSCTKPNLQNVTSED